MPKMKTKRIVKKKFRVNAKGLVKHARANTSHLTGDRSAKRMRQLRHTKVLDKTSENVMRRLLPHALSSK